VDEPGILKTSGCDGNRLAASAQHVCDKFLRHYQLVRFGAVSNQKQPAAKSFFESVLAVARGSERDLADESIGVTQEYPLKRPLA